ncbi:MAG TPA: hypothetical protein VNI81_09930 [Candidatus Limnocylindrales bacterium]|nr:hypothetical protein [Candidatus Limnocylindrales bacterium]
MRAAILLFAAISLQNPQSPSPQQGVVERGDHVMGFSHEKTAHHFLLYPNGGEINVSVNDPSDKASIEQIRMHLGHIAKMFAAGDFKAPMLIHDTNPPGVPAMIRLKGSIKYDYFEAEHGARIRLSTKSGQAVDAIHAFLLFQIIDHQTGDKPSITNAPQK